MKPSRSIPSNANSAKRPWGLPQKALSALAGYMFLPAWLMSIAVNEYMIYYHLNFVILAEAIFWNFLLTLALIVPLGIPFVYGRLYAIYYFRMIGFTLGFLHSFLIIFALYLWNSGIFIEDSGLGPLFMLIVLLVLSPLTILYVRALLVVRWLDPKSRPEEWEPPAYKDPRSWFYKK